MTRMILTLFVAFGLVITLVPRTSHAGVEACGDIYLEAGVECELIPPSAECNTQCTPISVQATCAAQLQAECSAECTGSASVQCTGSCETDCSAACTANPGAFECSGYCTADCAAGCDASCDDSECQATCEANCSATCDAQCEGVAPSANCDAKCSGSCEGSCTAESTLECQSSCTGSLYAECSTEVTGGCMTACESEEGALFCDGQYVDYEGNLDECVAALKALFDIDVEGYANAECSGNSCTAEAGGSASCSTGGASGLPLAFAVLLLVGLLRSRRRC